MASVDWLSAPLPSTSQFYRAGDELYRSKGKSSSQCFLSKTKSTVTDYGHTTTKLASWTDDWLRPPAPATTEQFGSCRSTIERLIESDDTARIAIREAGDGMSSESFWAPKGFLEAIVFDGKLQEWDVMYENGMHVSDSSLHCLLDECIVRRDLAAGREVHCCVVSNGYESNAFLGSHLIRMFAVCGSLVEAQQIFSKSSEPDVFIWSAIISAHSQHGQGKQAIKLYHQMQYSCIRPDGHVFSAVLKACAIAGDLVEGKLIHAEIMQSGMEEHVFIGNTLIDMYITCGNFQAARTTFDKVPERNVVTWNAMIAGLAQHGFSQEALQLFEQMQQEEIQPNQVTFVSILKACGSIVTGLNEGKKVHAQLIECGVESDIYINNTLVYMYSKCGSLVDAERVLQRLTSCDIVAWNVIISGHAQNGHGDGACQVFWKMQEAGIEPDEITFASIFKSCIDSRFMKEGRVMHALAIQHGLDLDTFVGNALIDMYARCGRLTDACGQFNKLPNPDMVTWNEMITGHTNDGFGGTALEIFQQMQNEGLRPNVVTFLGSLKACSEAAALKQGELIHSQVIENGLELDMCVGSALIDMYSRCDNFENALVLFSRLPKQNAVTWRAIIAGCALHKNAEKTMCLFLRMQQEGIEADKTTFASTVKACSSIAVLDDSKLIHTTIIGSGREMDPLVSDTLIEMYAKCGRLQDAVCVFEKLQARDVETWNSMITAYGQHGQDWQALQLFQEMQEEGVQPDMVTYLGVLRICSNIAAMNMANQIYGFIIESGLELNISIGSALVDMFMKCGSITDALRIFNKAIRDASIWNAMISGYAQQNPHQKTLELLQQMQMEGVDIDNHTILNFLRAYSSTLTLDEGNAIHNFIIKYGLESEFRIANVLIDMYTKCGSMKSAQILFDKLPKPDVVTWSAIIAGYTKSGYEQLALQFFEQMLLVGVDPDPFTFVSSLKACSSIAAVDHGKHIHTLTVDSGYESNLFVGNSLVLLYTKSGCLENAHRIFKKMPVRDLVTWNTMIAAYAQLFDYGMAKQCFEDMQEEGLKPSGLTFCHLLSACSHAGLMDEGCKHFKSMRDQYSLAPTLEHYNCLVDLLGRTGNLNQCEDLLENMPFELNVIGWTSLLSNCGNYGEVDIGKRCFDSVITMDPRNAAGYVLMSNIYVHLGMFESAAKIEELRQCANAWKKPGRAFIEVDNEVHNFIVGDTSHPRKTDIYAKLERLSVQMRDEGYMPFVDSLLRPLASNEKEGTLCEHCERLAIAFGLISTPRGTTIRVTKNLRVCVDCHNATKIISKIERREIVVTDAYCIHAFKDGECSCKDKY